MQCNITECGGIKTRSLTLDTWYAYLDQVHGLIPQDFRRSKIDESLHWYCMYYTGCPLKKFPMFKRPWREAQKWQYRNKSRVIFKILRSSFFWSALIHFWPWGAENIGFEISTSYLTRQSILGSCSVKKSDSSLSLWSYSLSALSALWILTSWSHPKVILRYNTKNPLHLSTKRSIV